MSITSGMKTLLAALLILALVTACATTTGDANLVRLTSNPEQVKGCKFLGEVRGSGASANPFNSVEMSGENSMRKHAVKLGATHVLLTYQSGSGTRGVSAGEAYMCKEEPIK